MTGESKFFIGIGIITLAVIAGGVFFFSQSQPSQTTAPATFDKTQLIQGAKHSKGDANAPIQIVEFADLQCPACQTAQPIINQALEKYSNNVYFVFRHYPLSIHRNAQTAAEAAEAAGEQGKFFEMVDLLYTNQKEWEQKASPGQDFQNYATQLGLDLDRFEKDLEKDWENIDSDYKLGNSVQVTSTPTFFINGQMYPGVIPQDKLESIIQSFLPQNQEATETPQK